MYVIRRRCLGCLGWPITQTSGRYGQFCIIKAVNDIYMEDDMVPGHEAKEQALPPYTLV